MRLFVTTFTGASSSARSPVGGGVAVLEGLYPHLAAEPELDVTVLRPGAEARTVEVAGLRCVELPLEALRERGADSLLAIDERAYGRAAFEWEHALGRFFESVEPRGALVLANDVSEGPPFARLAARGFRQAVIYHVVVGDFFARRYLRLSAARGAALWRAARSVGLSKLLPRLVELVWRKEEDAARNALALVPSADLGRALAAMYPRSGVGTRTHVLPWGVLGEPAPELRAERDATLRAIDLPPERFVLMTMSRLSPEKRVELLLDALLRIEREAPRAADAIALLVAGAPAYMGGAAYAGRLEARAARLERVRVRFAGYAAESTKWRWLAAADLFASTSTYEAYGLSIAQALAAGTPVLATDHQGARAILEPSFGALVRPNAKELARGIREALERDPRPLRERAAAWGRAHPFADSARELIALLRAHGADETRA